MTKQSMKYKLPKELRHVELGKTLVNKDLYFEAFDHFKKASIQTGLCHRYFNLPLQKTIA